MLAWIVCAETDPSTSRNDWTTALHGTVGGNFVGSTSAVNLALAISDVHVLGEPTNVGLVPLDGARQLMECPACHLEANPVIHEPRRLLRHPKGAAQFMRLDAVLGISNQPNRREPLVKAESRVLEDGADLERELTLVTTALPDAASRNEDGITLSTAGATNDAISPTQALDELEATVGVRRES